MKLTKHIALSAVLLVSICCAILYTSTSCTKTACGSVTCLNKGTCNGGVCTCPVGIGGTNCQTVYIRAFDKNIYGGTAVDDTAASFIRQSLKFSKVSDTDFVSMTMEWTDSAGQLVASLPVTLSNSTAAGSQFTIARTAVAPVTYSGSGTITATSVTLNLKEEFPAPAAVHALSFNNFLKQ